MNTHKLFNLAIAFVFAFSLFGVPAPVLATSNASVAGAPFTTCENVTEIPQAECEALIALYNSTDGAGWVNHTDWLTTDTPCSWYGVRCGGDHVTKLRLGANQLSGSIPSELGNLSQLTDLGLEFNQLTGSIPAELGNLAQFTWLNLAFNQLTGSLPTEIGELTQLTELYLFFNQLSGEFPSSITSLVNLTTLRYDCWLTSSDPVVIAFLNEKSAYQCAPNLQALPDEEYVSGENWPLGKTVTIEIDDPATQDVNPDHTGQAVVGIADWDPKKTWFGFYFIGEYNLKPGDLVTVSDNTTTKTHTVTSLAITNINPDTNIVSGTTNTGGSVDIWICDENNCVVRKEPVDQNGRWSANFGEPGDEGGEEDTFDIQSYTRVDAAQYDQERDSTQVNWSESNETNPVIIVRRDDNSVFGFYWPQGALLELEIDNPETSKTPDYTASQVFAGSDGWENGFELEGIFDIEPGYLVTLSDGNTTKQHTVTSLAVTNIDIDADTVSGTGYPGSEIHVGTISDDDGSNEASRNIYVDSSGNWLANFAAPVDPSQGISGIGTYDIRLGTGSGAYEIDEDADATSVSWHVPNHTFSVRANYDQVNGSEWILGSTIMIEIDDPSTETNPDYADTATVGLADWDPNQTYFGINTDGYDLKLGDIVTVTDGDITKQLTVSNFMITDVDIDTDQVYGIADPGQRVNIWTCWQSDPCVNRDETADQDGNWTTNFAVPGEQDWEQKTADLQTGSWIDSSVNDYDGDSIMFGWYLFDQSPYAPFVVLGQEGVWLKENTDVISGDVAANIASERPYLTDQSEVTIGQDVQFMDPSSRVMGDTVYLKQGSKVYEIYANELKGRGQILGVNHTPLELPLVPQLPIVPNVNPGTKNFDLKKNSTLTLDAGSYGKLETKKGATITFTGGVYHFTEWSLGDDVKVYFTAPTEIRIASKLDIGSDAFIGPATGADLTARNILIYVMGENGKNGKISASPKAANFGMRSTLIANVYTPNGTLWIHERLTATGAFFGKWVEIGQNVTLTLDNGWH